MNQEPKFVPGERAIVLSTVNRPELIGEPVVILSAAYGKSTNGRDIFVSWKYKTDLNSDDRVFAEFQLGKLPPNTPAQFDESIWVPKQDVV